MSFVVGKKVCYGHKTSLMKTENITKRRGDRGRKLTASTEITLYPPLLAGSSTTVQKLEHAVKRKESTVTQGNYRATKASCGLLIYSR